MGVKFYRQFRSRIEELIAEAAFDDDLEPYDPAELEALAAALSGHAGRTLTEIFDILRPAPFPKGFRHVRMTNLNTGSTGFGLYTEKGSGPDTATIALFAFEDPALDEVRKVTSQEWVETVILPMRNKGVLDIGFRYRPRSPKKVSATSE